MRLEYQIPAAFALDLLLGDPRWLPHPVTGIARLATGIESRFRRSAVPLRLAGAITAIIVVGATSGVTWAILAGARHITPLCGDVVAVLLLYTTFAARGLAQHSTDVYRALQSGDLAAARQRMARIVGRDTERLDEPGVVRAAVESVAENIVDGVTAPLFFAVLGGPVGAMTYKAVNTLDSLFGYRNERYADFGRASARLDDAANWLPARLTAPLVPVAAALLRLRPCGAARILWRDRRNHPSPNSGLTEAAVAGALGVQLGGLSYYGGKPSAKPTLGDPDVPPQRDHIPRANALMFATVLLTGAIFLTARLFLLKWCG